MRGERGRWLGLLAVACGALLMVTVLARPERAGSAHRPRHATDVESTSAASQASIVVSPSEPHRGLDVPVTRAERQPLISASVPPPAVADAPSPPSLWSAPPVVASSSSPLADVPPPQRLSRPRHVPFAALAAWRKPGLCDDSGDATAARAKLTESFRFIDGGERGALYLDPRLPEGAEVAVFGLLDQARAAASRELALSPPPPSVYVYFDEQLLKAAACINENVVAFYDGALHLVAGRPDLLASVVHEYTHHALFSSGLMGPAWAQEGIAMSVAGETWWRRADLLKALLQLPFSPDQLDSTIAYKLPAQQAVSFYVQSALTVECLKSRRRWTLRQLADELRAGSASDSLSYDLPELEQRSFASDCIAGLAPR